MRPFTYTRPQMAEAALAAWKGDGLYVAGGTNVADYMKLEVLQPRVLVDISRLRDPALHRIEIDERGIRLGALVRLAAVEDHADIRTRYPVIHDTLALAATRQIRNVATIGGNVLQRTRCEYFREISWPCNKRRPGAGCAAIGGVDRQHAILGTSSACIATYAGDFAQAMVALDAIVHTIGSDGPRRIPFADLHASPNDTPHIETILAPGELIVALEVPAGPHTVRSRYVKVRDRTSYQFALTGAAVAVHLERGVVQDARIALSGVATRPWRARQAERSLIGGGLTEGDAARAADIAFADAKPGKLNGFKIPIGKQTIVHALLEAKSMEVAA